MKELIKVTRHQGKKVVSARELYERLEVKTRFDTWFIRRVQEYGFQEDKDFCSILGESTGGRPSKDFAISIGMAKELGMLEGSENGSKIRKYFIEIEESAQPDFTPIMALEDHANPIIQKLNSKEVNTYNYEKGGTKLVISYNIDNCKYHLGVTPKQLKTAHPKIKGSAKDIARQINMVAACNMSLTDNFVKLGADHRKAAAISKEHGTPLFQFMIENRIAPGELFQK
jgi:phage anti-repressor protein